MARGRVGDQARGFVQDDQRGVFMDEFELNRFRGQGGRTRFREAHLDPVPRSEAIPRPGRGIVDPGPALPEEILGPGTAQVLHAGSQKGVDPLRFLSLRNQKGKAPV
jgi:hypothetical protein